MGVPGLVAALSTPLGSDPDPARFRIEPVGGYEPDLILAMLAAHALPGVERLDTAQGSHLRTLNTPVGPCAVALRFHADVVEVEVTPASSAGFAEVVVRSWLDLDSDCRLVAAAFASDPTLRPLAAERPGMRIVGYPEPFEAAVVSVLGQHVSVAAARTFGSRLVADLGRPAGELRTFPTPTAVLSRTATGLQQLIGVTSARAGTLRAVAELFESGYQLTTDGPGLPGLRALPGIGQWTVDYLELRATGDRDAFPAGDLVLRRGLGVRTAAEARRVAEPWRPYRGYATFHIWAQAAYPHLVVQRR